MNSNISYTTEQFKQFCVGKDCKREGTTLLKIKYLQKTGYFCNVCTSELLQLGLAVQEEGEQ
jgi:hypothetical protein